MKKIITSVSLAICIATSTAAIAAAQQAYEPPLSNAAIIKLVRAGFKEKTIIAIIHSRPSNFRLDPDRLIELKRNGVSENIILAMLGQDSGFSTDDWFGDMKSGGGPKSNSRDGETDIFGSGQGSKSESRSRGSHGGNQGERTTTGSATVRILRHPVEAGQAPKLEKTPTLNNESIIKLVEAGFSEGTIIKRIEESPADFDLSTTGIEELRRRRVTDTIISAMTSAMRDDSDPKTTSPGKTKVN